MTKKKTVSEFIDRQTSRIQKPNPKDYRYVGIIQWNNKEFRLSTAQPNFPWSDTFSVRKLLNSTYEYNKISAIDGAPSLEEILDQNLFDIEKFEDGGSKLLNKYSDKPD